MQATEDLRLVLEALRARGGRETGVQDLERDRAPRILLLRLVHDAHAAFAEQIEDAVAADALGEAQRFERRTPARGDARADDAVEPPARVVRSEQRVDLLPEPGVASAVALEQPLALGGLHLDRSHEDLPRAAVQLAFHSLLSRSPTRRSSRSTC